MTIDKEKYIGKALTKLFIEQGFFDRTKHNSDYEVVGYGANNQHLLYLVGITNSGVKHPVFGKKRLKYIENLLNSKIDTSRDKCNLYLTTEQIDNLYTLLKLKGDII